MNVRASSRLKSEQQIMGLWHLLTGRWHKLADPHDDFGGKTVIVTGPSIGGLGFEAASKIAARGAQRLILAARSTFSGEEAKRVIQQRHGSSCVIEVWPLDMNSYNSISAFGERVQTLEQLDVAILNAGVYMVNFQTSEYGWEETLQVNLLSTTLLALLLLPKLRQSGTNPVLEFVNSGRHTVVTAETVSLNLLQDNLLESYNDAGTYKSDLQYRMSKLFLMHVMQMIARSVKPVDASQLRPIVLVTSVCPGFCRSNLSRGYNNFAINILRWVIFQFVRTQEQGARTLVSGALLGPEAHGQFWKNDEIQSPAVVFQGEQGEKLRLRVWQEVIHALENDIPRVRQLLPG